MQEIQETLFEGITQEEIDNFFGKPEYKYEKIEMKKEEEKAFVEDFIKRVTVKTTSLNSISSINTTSTIQHNCIEQCPFNPSNPISKKETDPFEGSEIDMTEEEAEGYFVILDGQHRSTAFAKLNSVKGNMTIPNVFVKDIKDIGTYLEEINRVGNWDMKAKIGVAALTSKDELFENMAELIQQGFNPTTAGLIYTKKNIPEKILNKVLRREEYNLPKDAIVDIKRGNDFITLCKAAKISVTFLTKRYFIKGFNSYAKVHGEEQAFKALDKLKQLELNDDKLKKIKEDDDFQAMLQNALEA